MSAPTGFDSIPDYQKAEFVRHLEECQMKDSLKMYSNLVDICFDKCATGSWGGVIVIFTAIFTLLIFKKYLT